MGHRARALAHAGILLCLAGCGDALLITGDAPGVMRVVAGVPEAAGDSLGERATESLLNGPTGLVAGENGELFIADGKNARVLRITPDGAAKVVVDHGGLWREPRLHLPAGLALDGAGDLLVADPDGGRVWIVERGSGMARVVAGNGDVISTDTTVALETRLREPTDVAADGAGGFYLTERSGHRIRHVAADGSIATIAGDGNPGFTGDGGAAGDAQLDRPQGLAHDGGVLYVADSGNQRVRAIDLAGATIETIAGSGVTGFGGDGGPAVDALLDEPAALAIATERGVIFISEVGNQRVRAVMLDSGRISTFAGTGDTEFAGDLLSAGATSLNEPRGLAVSRFGILFVSVARHHIVYRTALGLQVNP